MEEVNLCEAVSLKVPEVLTLSPLIEGFQFLEVSIGLSYSPPDAPSFWFYFCVFNLPEVSARRQTVYIDIFPTFTVLKI